MVGKKQKLLPTHIETKINLQSNGLNCVYAQTISNSLTHYTYTYLRTCTYVHPILFALCTPFHTFCPCFNYELEILEGHTQWSEHTHTESSMEGEQAYTYVCTYVAMTSVTHYVCMYVYVHVHVCVSPVVYSGLKKVNSGLQ